MPNVPQPERPSTDSPAAWPDNGPLLVSVAEAHRRLGIGRTALYELLGRGEVRSRKIGRRTLIESASLVEFVSTLPMGRSRATTRH